MVDRNRELEGKVAIVTGSARNIGRATAEELARAGASVVINALTSEDLCKEVVAGIEKDGGKAIAVRADITKQEDVDRMVAETVAAFGGIDILVNNAATRTKRHFTELDFAEWEKLRAVALDGAFRMSMACVPHIIERGGGAVVGIHGMGSYAGAPNGAHKSAVKDAMAGMTRGMARDLGEHNIRCNIAVVGAFETDRAGGSGENQQRAEKLPPVGRNGNPMDMAHCVRFLVGPYASYISGQTIQLNGGLLMPQ
jgi:3-oxoacyl-[acyl-carrier protein] reductase